MRSARAIARTIRTPGSIRSKVEALLLDHLLRRPMLYEDSRGLRYLLYPGENALIYLQNEGNYEVGETLLCERVVREGMTVFDVGSHIGLYSLLFARLVGEKGVTHAFEPDPRNFERLRTNLALNDAENVFANQCAVFRESGPIRLNLFDPSLNAWHSLGTPRLPDPHDPRQTVESHESITVAAVSLDEYARERNISRVDFLKVDVEGAELDVLHGATGLFEREAIGLVQFEVSLPQTQALGHDGSEIFGFFGDRRFVCRPISDDGSLEPSVTRPTNPYGNYLAAPEAVVDSL
jgi:FkbM family methyltransferase